MIRNSPLGWGAEVDVLVGNVPFNPDLLSSITVELDENRHDIVTLHVSGLIPRAVTEYRNAPVRVHYSTGGFQHFTFMGYIQEVRPSSVTNSGLTAGSPINEADILCFGVSYSMRGKTSKSWGRESLTTVAKEMAREYQLSLSCPDLPPVFDNLLQQDESDFAFLARTAVEHGYRISVHGTHLDIWDPYAALERRKGLAYLKTLTGVKGNYGPSPGQIIEFHGTFGRNAADGVYKGTEVTVMDKRGVTFDVGDSDAKFPNRITGVIDSYSEAEAAIQSAKRESYDYTANVKTTGVASAVPGTVVDVQGFKTDYDGYWYVRGVKHAIATGVFITDFELARNATSTFSPKFVAPFRTPPAPSFVDGRWRASRLKSHIYE